ncbi:Rrf2 family transcriptional regulator [Acidaminobacter sp. JC074]|uniref:RrF2 family transcriptional regulator n=1 Tax=Acidaminobacter sp. JC074 TaxID=2530199 RepID=UPI001F0F2072|nr:Rrf2 family transcriptional regulator [Acidaminobacter sp. JC074]
MKITSKSKVAIKCLIILGAEDKRLSVREIAEKDDLSVRYLEQIIASLKKHGMVDSVKGASGGYAIIGSTDQISVYDVVVAIDGDHSFSEALETVLDELVFKPLDESIKEHLSSIKLSKLIEAYKLKTNSEYMYYI